MRDSDRLMRVVAVGACSVVCACAPAALLPVPLRFAERAERARAIAPDDATATIIFKHSRMNEVDRAITVTLNGERFVGDLDTHSWMVAKVPPGSYDVVSGVPEVGAATCGLLPIRVVAAKVYAVDVAHAVPAVLDDEASRADLGRELSLYSYLVPDEAGGQAAVSEAGGFWSHCRAQAAQTRAAVAKFLVGSTEQIRRTTELAPEFGCGKVVLAEDP